MFEKKAIKSQSIGDRRKANKHAQLAFQHIPAYRGFLAEHGINNSNFDFEQLPLTDKQNYFSSWPYSKLIPKDHFNEILYVLRSSGSSGRPFYWPQLKSQYRNYDSQLERLLIHLLDVNKKKTLCIVGLALGSWIGGELVSWVLKNISLRAKYPLTVFSPGNQHEEILDMIKEAGSLPDQILIFLCPSAISQLFALAKHKKITLPYKKLRFGMIGEPFSEEFRRNITDYCHMAFPEIIMASIYGAADTGMIGVETKFSIALRHLLDADSKVREALEIGRPLPNLYHITARDTYIESIGKELVFTRWQGVPLMRYNLHDEGGIFCWNKIKDALRRLKLSEENEKIKSMILNNYFLPDLIAIHGRTDGMIILCGTNITESMLLLAMEDPELKKTCSGAFKVRLAVEPDGRQILCWDIELSPGTHASAGLEDSIYRTLVERLGHVQPEFASDYQQMYRYWDGDREKRIFRINLLPWPALRDQNIKVKSRAIDNTNKESA
jgi:phenylacetate-CoA ligase